MPEGELCKEDFVIVLELSIGLLFFFGHNSYALCFSPINAGDLKSMLFVKTVMHMCS